MSDEQAKQTLLSNISGDMITEPRQLKYRTGSRQKSWHKNCIALGLASGFIEPLESTSIHLVMTAIIRLIRLFPFGDFTEALADRFNQETRTEIETVRDFVILHYKQTHRTDSDFWNAYRTMEIPDTLAHRLHQYALGEVRGSMRPVGAVRGGLQERTSRRNFQWPLGFEENIHRRRINLNASVSQRIYKYRNI